MVLFLNWNMIVLISLPSPSLLRKHFIISSSIYLLSLPRSKSCNLVHLHPHPFVRDRRHLWKTFSFHPRRIEKSTFLKVLFCSVLSLARESIIFPVIFSLFFFYWKINSAQYATESFSLRFLFQIFNTQKSLPDGEFFESYHDFPPVVL